MDTVNFVRAKRFMFNRYWRSYPWFFQLVQFIILILVLASFFLFAMAPLVMNALKVTAADITGMNEHSPRNVINAALILQLLTAVGIFLLPALLFAYFTHPRPAQYLGLKPPANKLHWIMAPLVIISATPLFLFIAELMSQIDFGASVKAAQEANDNAFKALLNMSSPAQLLASFLILAVLPGFSEELFFRGLLMRFAAKRSVGILFPLLLSALLFALMHSNPYGMLSIFLAGLLLGGIYYLTGSLWCSIVAHACYNGLQVLLTYAANHNSTLKAISDSNHVPVSWIIVGTSVFAASFFLLWKTRKPLPKDWSADYTPEELIEEAQ
jgi:uncharacterized protein